MLSRVERLSQLCQELRALREALALHREMYRRVAGQPAMQSTLGVAAKVALEAEHVRLWEQCQALREEFWLTMRDAQAAAVGTAAVDFQPPAPPMAC